MSSSSSRSNICALIACCVLLLIDMQLMSQFTVTAQQGCPIIAKLANPPWRPYYPVTVIFNNDSNWNDAEIAAMSRTLGVGRVPHHRAED